MNPLVGEWVKIESMGTLPPGGTLRVEAGGVAFVSYFEGSLSRVEGPAELVLQESHRSIEGSSMVSSFVTKWTGKDPLGKSTVQSSINIQLRSGTVITRKPQAVTPGSSFIVAGPRTYALTTGASWRMSLTPQGEVEWESVEGNTTLAMVSVQDKRAAPVVLTSLPPGTRIVTPSLPTEFQDSPIIGKLGDKIATAASSLQQAVSPLVTVGDIPYRLVQEPAQPTYYLGESQALAPDAPPPTQVVVRIETEVVSEIITEEVWEVPGQEVVEVTDSTLQTFLDTGVLEIPGIIERGEMDIPPEVADLFKGATIHIAPNGVLEVMYQGVLSNIKVDTEGGMARVSGLPLGVDPTPYVEDAYDKYGDTIPTLLSLASESGKATIIYLPDEPIKKTLQREVQRTIEKRVEEQIALPVMPHTAPYFSAIAAPQQISTDWKVVGSNIALAGYIGILLKVLMGQINTALKAQEAHLVRFFSFFTTTFRGVARVSRRFFGLLSRIPLHGIFGTIALLLLNGLIYSFLDTRFVPWEGRGLTVLPLITLTTALTGLLDPIARSFLYVFWKKPVHFTFYAAGLLLTSFSVGISRGFQLSPGLLFGSTGGMKAPQLDARQKFIATMFATTFVFLFGMVAWGITFLLPKLPDLGVPAELLQSLKGVTSFIQDASLMIFAAILSRTFYALMPLPGSTGEMMWQKNRVLWAVYFGIVTFIFLHTMLNKQASLVTLLQKNTALAVGITVGVAALALGLWGYNKTASRKK